MSNKDEAPNFSFALMRTKKGQEGTSAPASEKYDYFAVEVRRWHGGEPSEDVAAVMDAMAKHGVSVFHVAGPAEKGQPATRLMGTFVINLDAFDQLAPVRD